MFIKVYRKVYQLLLLFLSMTFFGTGLTAQGVHVLMEDVRDCNQNTYCVSLKLKTSGAAIDIGTSSIFLKYNATALAYSSYTSTHFDGSDQCIQDQAAAWDVQTFDATSAPGFFNVTMTLLMNQFSCPSINEEAIEVGVLCFNVLDEQKAPNMKVLKNNTSFNSSEPNTGEKLQLIKHVDHIKNPKALSCSESTIDCQQQKELWEETEVEIPITNCEELAAFCTGISFNNKGAYELTINDQAIEELEKCENGSTSLFYTYSSFLKLEKGGSFEIVNWKVNGQNHTESFSNTEELINLLNKWDADGNWEIDTKVNMIVGGNPDQTYSTIEIKNKETDLSIGMALNKKVSDYATSVLLAEGVHQLKAINKFTKCTDEITIVVTCSGTAEDRVEAKKEATIHISKDTSICLSAYIADSDFIEDCSDDQGEFSEMTIDNQTNCINFLANADGSDTYCLYICNEKDDCTTLTLTVEISKVKNPILRDDRIAVMMNESKEIDVLRNDFVSESISDFEIPYSRMDGSTEVDEIAQMVTYTPAYNVCGVQDSFQYKVTTDVGESIATVYLEILCEELTVFSGFSPNGDGINDYFKIMGIENFEENELVIFNSRGNEVFSKNGYQNEDGWDGTWKGKDLPDGTYFYMLRLNTRQPVSGYIQLQR